MRPRLEERSASSGTLQPLPIPLGCASSPLAADRAKAGRTCAPLALARATGVRASLPRAPVARACTLRTSLLRAGLTLSLALGLLVGSPAQAQPSLEIPNLSVVKHQVRQWVDSGEYQRELEVINARAAAYLEANLAGVERPALVLDIDETALSNYPFWDQCDFGWDEPGFNAWVEGAHTPAIPSTLGLYRTARARGVAVFFITGREESLRAATERDLRQAGYEGWDGLFFKPDDYSEKSVSAFKTSVRRHLWQEGWRIVVNEGDQMSDLEGGYAMSVFKLPNPMYFVP